MSAIKFVYFDVGGVMIRDFSDTNKWKETADFLKIPPENKQLFFDLYNQADDQICLGQLTIDVRLRNIQNQLNITVPPDFSFLKYFIDNFSQNTSLWPVVERLKARVSVGLLTDMWTDMFPLLQQQNLLPKVEWNAVVDSTIEHVRKPMPEIYQLATKRAGVNPEEILFIDNRQKNLDGAARAGWQTYLYDSRDYEKSTKELANFFSNLL